MNWYDEFIEEGIRKEVRLLRENGFNTISSSGDKKVIDCMLHIDGDLQRLHDLLYNNNYKFYIIESYLEIEDGRITNNFVTVSFRD